MTSALTATCAGKPHPLISRAATTAATPMCLSNRPPRRRRRFVRKPWKDVRSKPSATMAKALIDLGSEWHLHRHRYEHSAWEIYLAKTMRWHPRTSYIVVWTYSLDRKAALF